MPKLPSLNPDRSAIPQKSATFSNCKSAAHFRPPSTQLKPISIFLKGEFAAAHSRKGGICSGSQPQGRNLRRLTAARSEFAVPHGYYYKQKAPSLNSDRFTILQKSATLSKVGICSGSQPQGRNLL